MTGAKGIFYYPAVSAYTYNARLHPTDKPEAPIRTGSVGLCVMVLFCSGSFWGKKLTVRQTIQRALVWHAKRYLLPFV